MLWHSMIWPSSEVKLIDFTNFIFYRIVIIIGDLKI